MNSETTQIMAMTDQPDPKTLFDRGNGFIRQNRPLDAVQCYRQMLQLEPDTAVVYCNRGIALDAMNRPEDALACCLSALQLNPTHLESQLLSVILFRKTGRLAESVASAQAALQLRPDSVPLHYSLGITLRQQKKLDEALASFRHALRIDPDYADALSHEASVFCVLGKLDEAEARYRRVLQLKPDSDITQVSLAMVLLERGKFTEGWERFEHRWFGSHIKYRRPETALRAWRGELPGPKDGILIFEEQGAGDRIQFSRYLTLLKARFAGKISMIVHRDLRTLLQRSFPFCEFLDTVPSDQSAWQWHSPLLSLPLAFNTVPETVPAAVPYLTPDPERVRRYRRKISALSIPLSAKKIGVVWKSTSRMPNTAERSIRFEQIAPLFQLPGTVWFSLQKEALQDEPAIAQTGTLTDWTKDFLDFDDTAALIMNLDLIISVDTSVAHLAGATGKPVWLLNQHLSEWRWMRGREDSLWYPTMRILTQRNDGDWAEVIDRVGTLLCGPDCRVTRPATSALDADPDRTGA